VHAHRYRGERAAERVSQLGGAPGRFPAGLSRSQTAYLVTEATDLRKMLEENLVAERIVISSYREIIRWPGTAIRPRRG
jgi:bacterioferritin